MSLHMVKMFSSAFYFDYHVVIYQYALAYGHELKSLWCNFTVLQKLHYYFDTLLDYSYSKFPIVRYVINKILKCILDKLVQRVHDVFGVNPAGGPQINFHNLF